MKHNSFQVRDIRTKEKFVVDDEYLNGYARLCGIIATGVYMSLCRHSNKEQNCFPSKKLISDELDVSEKSVYTAIKKLEEWGIIEVQNQGKKKDGTFYNNIYVLLDKSNWKPKPQVTVTDGKSQPQVNDDTHRRYVVPNKETHIKDIYNIATQDVADINSLISLFKGINPSYERLYSNKSQRQSMERLVKKYGVENISAVITEWLPKTNAMQFSPQIHTPYELEQKLGKLKSFIETQKNKKSNSLKDRMATI